MMSSDPFSQWAIQFRRDAVKDKMALLKQHLQRVGLPDEPEKLIDGTIMVMSACCAYLDIDGRSIDDLAMQAYRPDREADTCYSFTFNIFDRAFGRVIAPRDIKCLDLADLHDHPWHDFKICGYSDSRVARLDDRTLSDAEIEEVESVITDDIRFDDSEDEVDIFIDRETIDGGLIVYLYDIIADHWYFEAGDYRWRTSFGPQSMVTYRNEEE